MAQQEEMSLFEFQQRFATGKLAENTFSISGGLMGFVALWL